MDLVRRSAQQASAKLQFCRIAFGAAGSAGSHLDLKDAGEVAKNFIGDEKIELLWETPNETREKNQVKLLLNLLLLATTTIPRGGRIGVVLTGDAIAVRANGENAKMPDKTVAFMNDPTDDSDMDARLVQVYYTMRLAQSAGYSLIITQEDTDIIIRAEPAAATVAA